MKKIIIWILLVLAVIGVWVLYSFKKETIATTPSPTQKTGQEAGGIRESASSESLVQPVMQVAPVAVDSEPLYIDTVNIGPEGFPAPSVEVINGKIEHTIHMGVRQYVWEPSRLTVKKGELVRLVIHNADVLHGLAIPELGVNQDIPPEGAIIEFTPAKTGTFPFLCSIRCGEGHMGMWGEIVVQ